MHRLLILMLLFAPSAGEALGVPKTCPLKSQQIKLARECFSGDMRAADDFGTFLGTDEGKDDLNYCFNAFVLVHAKRGGEVRFSVWKDSPKGDLHIYNYTVVEQALQPAKGRSPSSAGPTAVTFKNLKAECFATKQESDKCSKGVFGFGSSDLPMTVELAKSRSGGYTVKGQVRDAKLIDSAGDKRTLDPKGMGDVAQTDQWLLQVVKQRLVTTAQRKLAMIKQGRLNRQNLGDATSQFRYCRMALEGFLHKKKLPDPFTPAERKTLDSLEDHLKATMPQ